MLILTFRKQLSESFIGDLQKQEFNFDWWLLAGYFGHIICVHKKHNVNMLENSQKCDVLLEWDVTLY